MANSPQFKAKPSCNQSVTNRHGLKRTPAVTKTTPEQSAKTRRKAVVFFETESQAPCFRCPRWSFNKNPQVFCVHETRGQATFSFILLKNIDGKFIADCKLGSSTRKCTIFHEWGAASPVNVLIGFLRVFGQFDSIAPALSPFGPSVGCSTSCPPRHSVVV